MRSAKRGATRSSSNDNKANKTPPQQHGNSEDEDDEFEDAKTDLDYEDFTVSAPPQHR